VAVPRLSGRCVAGVAGSVEGSSIVPDMDPRQRNLAIEAIRKTRGECRCSWCGELGGVEVQRWTGLIVESDVPGDLESPVRFGIPCLVSFCAQCGHVDWHAMHILGVTL
jgi:hypothetical protein